MEKLIDIGVSKQKLLKIDGGVLSDEAFAQMHTWQDAEDRKILWGWIEFLKPYGVYFSAPLDLDLAMLSAFPEAYKAIVPKGGGPKMAVDKAAEVVFGTTGPGLTLYTGAFKEYPNLLPAYRANDPHGDRAIGTPDIARRATRGGPMSLDLDLSLDTLIQAAREAFPHTPRGPL